MKNIHLILSGVSIFALASCSNNTTITDNLNPVVADKKFPAAYQYQNSQTQVISPYKPHNVINVKGLKPGHLARDTSTAKLDSAGKPITSTAKIFRIPDFKAADTTQNWAELKLLYWASELWSSEAASLSQFFPLLRE